MGNFCRDTKGYHYTIPEAFDPSLSYDMQYQRLRNIVLKIIDEMEINVPYLIMTKVTHTNDSITITGSLYQDYKFVSLNNTFSLVGLGDGTYYLNLNNRHKYAPCDKDIVSVPFEGTMYVSTQYMPKDELTLYSITKENGVVTSVEYNDIYTGMHNIAEDAHKNRFSDVYAKIQAEIDRATSAEETLDKKIEDETDRAEASESALDDKIEAETQRATSAETQLQNNITAETNRATSKENQLSAAITAEQQRAEQAERQITNAVNTEVQNRTAAEISITEDMTNLVDTEKDRAIAAEENLQSQFNNWEEQLDGVETKVDAKQDKIGAVQGNATDMEITGIPATNSIAFKGENGDILAVKTKAPASPTDAVPKALLDTQVNLITSSIGQKQDKIGAVQGNATDMEITGIPAIISIAFKSTNDDILVVKTGTPSSIYDSANKKYVDEAIANYANLTWNTQTIYFFAKDNQSTPVASHTIYYAEDNDFIYLSFDCSITAGIYNASATLSAISTISSTKRIAPISYVVKDSSDIYTSKMTITAELTSAKSLQIKFDNNDVGGEGSNITIMGVYLIKKNESTI